MTSVFVLHAIEDQALASKVAEALLLEGHAVRKDLSRIEREPGPMIVVWSPAATRDQSVVDWTAVMMERELLIPVCVGLPINPEEFESTPPIDLSGWGGDLDDPRWRFVMDEVALMDQREQLHDGEVWSDASTPIPEAAADSIEPQQSLEPETLERPADEPPAAPAEPQFIQETFLEWPAPALEQVAAEAVSSLEKEGDWDTPEDVQTAEPAPYETDFLQGELFSEGGANEARDTGVYMPSGFSPRQVLWGGGALLLATALGALTVGSIMLNRPAQVQDPVNGPMAATEEPAPAVIDPVEEPQIAVAQVRGERFVVPDATVDKAPDPAPTAVTAPTLDLAAADDVPSPSLADLTPRPPTLAPSRQATVDEAAPAESLVQLALIDEGFIGEGDVSYEPEETSITAEAPAGDFVGVEQQTGAGSFDALADAALDDDLAANELDSLVAVVALETNANTDVTESSNLGAYLRDCFDCPDMASLPAGSFMMGAAADESCGGLDHHRKDPAIVALMDQDTRLGQVPRERITQHEIPVVDGLASSERNPLFGLAAGDLELVRPACNRPDRKRGGEPDGDRDPVAPDHVRQGQPGNRRIGRRRAEGPAALLCRLPGELARHRVGGDALPSGGLRHRPGLFFGHIARADDQRHAKFVGAVDPRHDLAVFERHRDRLAGHQVGDFLGEHVGTVLFEQGRRLAFGFRGLEGLPRLGLLRDLSADALVAHLHHHRMHRGVLVERKEIARVQRPVCRVEEDLADAYGRKIALDVTLDLGLQDRQRDLGAAHLGDEVPAQRRVRIDLRAQKRRESGDQHGADQVSDGLKRHDLSPFLRVDWMAGCRSSAAITPSRKSSRRGALISSGVIRCTAVQVRAEPSSQSQTAVATLVVTTPGRR